ncbi:MAG: carboxypeptidase regulatory-like domain-containing protein, partial [Acidobacteria bacterium]
MRLKSRASNITRTTMTLIIIAVLSFVPLLAQTGANTGVQGRVIDPSGGTIPGATVTVTRADTGEVRSAVTDDTGNWEVRHLTPGVYTLTFEMTGFKKLIQSGVNVTTSEIATVNVAMQLGEIGQTVEVTSDAEMVSSTSATVIKTLDKREL